MKKIITILLTLSMIMSLFSGITVFADGAKVLYEYTFDDDVTDLPQGLTSYISKTNEAYVQSRFAYSGKALKVRDEDTGSVTFRGPLVKAEAGKIYTASVMTYVESGYLSMGLGFYDKDQKSIGGKNDSNAYKEWRAKEISLVAPEGTAYCSMTIMTYGNTTGVGYFDNLKIIEGIEWPVKPIQDYVPEQKDPVEGKLIVQQGDKLQYNTYSDKGDKLTDFSKAGFYAGKYEIPDSSKIKVVATIEPSKDKNEDDTERIQKVIDEVFENAPNNFFKVIKLKAGRYNINKNGISLKSGIILSGEGQGPSGTVLYAFDKTRYSVIKVHGMPKENDANIHYVTNKYIPAGSDSVTLSASDIANYKVGDLVAFYYPSTDEWCKAMDMVGMKGEDGLDSSWKAGQFDREEIKTITEINGNTVKFDIPFYVPYYPEYSTPYICKVSDGSNLEHVGIENLRVESAFADIPTDEEHAETAISFGHAKNCYVRDVSAKYFVLSVVNMAGGSRQISVVNCSMLEPVSTLAGGRRYSFCIGPNTQQCLVKGCYTYSGRHDYITSGAATGPSVFVNNVADSSNANSETHGLWVTGILYDNLHVIGSQTAAIGTPNYGVLGSGGTPSFGWTGGGVIIYNCLATDIIGANPPMEYNNFLIGSWGNFTDETSKKAKEKTLSPTGAIQHWRTGSQYSAKPENFATIEGSSFIGDAYKESDFAPVEPRSLYKAQLAERLTGSIKNAKPNSPVIISPRGEFEHKLTSNTFSIDGIYQKGAQKVTVYIDNKAYDATLNNKDYTFTLPVELNNGTHKVYATQTIDGVESTKCADRFIVVNNVSSSNPEYLQSQYEYDKIHMTTNDNIISFDEYQAPLADLPPEIITVKIGESLLVTDVDPVEINGRVLVPMRAIFETFESEVSWDEATATATAVRGDTVIKVTENNQIVKVNGEDKWLDVPATIINGRFVVPVRFISETFGATVGWIDGKRQVTIKGAAPLYIADHGFENEINIYGLEQSGDNGTGDVIDRAFDGNMKTTWTFSTKHENGAWGIFDFGFARDIKEMYLAFGMGTARVHSFDIYVSNDRENFTLVKENLSSSGQTEEFQKFEIGARGRYVKIVGKGNNLAGKEEWNNYFEMTFIEEK